MRWDENSGLCVGFFGCTMPGSWWCLQNELVCCCPTVDEQLGMRSMIMLSRVKSSSVRTETGGCLFWCLRAAVRGSCSTLHVLSSLEALPWGWCFVPPVADTVVSPDGSLLILGFRTVWIGLCCFTAPCCCCAGSEQCCFHQALPSAVCCCYMRASGCGRNEWKSCMPCFG